MPLFFWFDHQGRNCQIFSLLFWSKRFFPKGVLRLTDLYLSLRKGFWQFLNFKHDCNFPSEYTVQSNFSSPCLNTSNKRLSLEKPVCTEFSYTASKWTKRTRNNSYLCNGLTYRELPYISEVKISKFNLERPLTSLTSKTALPNILKILVSNGCMSSLIRFEIDPSLSSRHVWLLVISL